METYNGQVRTPKDAIILFEACRLGLLPRVQRRLSEKERQSIRSGSVFVWDEREAGMRRWTDGKSWSASRVSGSFLTYREMEGKRGGNSFVTPVNSNPVRGNKSPEGNQNNVDDGLDGEEGPDGYRYKPDGLMKQSFSLTTSTGQHLHLISYYSRSHPAAQVLRQPSNDPSLASIQIPKGMYPESTITDASNTPAVTRSPMPGAPNYVMAAGAGYARPAHGPPPGYLPGYIPHPGYMYPLSPLHTPPGYPIHFAHALPAYYHPAAYGPPPPPPHLHTNIAPPSSFDQRPLRNSVNTTRSPPRTSLTIPNVSSYGQDKSPVMTANGQPYPITPSSERAPSVQIDPRLTEQQNSNNQSSSMPGSSGPLFSQQQSQQQTETMQRQNSQQYQHYQGYQHQQQQPSHYHSQPQTSQPPSISHLVHAAQQATPLTNSQGHESEAERQGSVSPGGTRYGAPPQDIPSEKFPFREDKMALSKLDRVFARV